MDMRLEFVLPDLKILRIERGGFLVVENNFTVPTFVDICRMPPSNRCLFILGITQGE